MKMEVIPVETYDSNVTDASGAAEKRSETRLKCTVPLKYKSTRDVMEVAKVSITNDISENGICFFTKNFMYHDHRIALEIDLPSEQEPIRVISKLAWLKKAGDYRYRAGYKFIDLSENDHNRLKSFLSEQTTNT